MKNDHFMKVIELPNIALRKKSFNMKMSRNSVHRNNSYMKDGPNTLKNNEKYNQSTNGNRSKHRSHRNSPEQSNQTNSQARVHLIPPRDNELLLEKKQFRYSNQLIPNISIIGSPENDSENNSQQSKKFDNAKKSNHNMLESIKQKESKQTIYYPSSNIQNNLLTVRLPKTQENNLNLENFSQVQTKFRLRYSFSNKSDKVVRDKYYKLRKIASEDEVYLCLDVQDNCLKCLKIFPISFYAKQEDIENSFLRLQRLMEMESQFIVKIFEFFQDDYFYTFNKRTYRSLFLITDYYQIHLSDLVGKLNLDQIDTIYRQVKNGIEAMHHESIVCENLCPQNILIDKSLNAILQVPFQALTNQGHPVFLTFDRKFQKYYDPYEKLVEEVQVHRKYCDLWSVGIIFFQLVSEQRIFVMRKHHWIKVPAQDQNFPAEELKNLSRHYQMKQVIENLLKRQYSKRKFAQMSLIRKNTVTNLKKIDRYHLIKKLKVGGQGIVYLCIDLLENEIKIMKIMPIEHKTQSKIHINIQKNIQQAQVLNNLCHKNIIKVHQFFQDSFYYENHKRSLYSIFIVEDFVQGGELTYYLGALDHQKIIEIYKQIRSALEYIHSQGVIHRDISLDNILLDKSMNCILTDFGICTVTSHVTEGTFTQFNNGKELYRSQQQFNYSKISAKSDLWAFGIVMLQLLFGKEMSDIRENPELKIPSIDSNFPKKQFQKLKTHPLLGIVQNLLKELPQQRNFIDL